MSHHQQTDQLTHLISAVSKFAAAEGDYPTAIPTLSLHARHHITEPLHCIYNLGLAVVLQGDKEIIIGDTVYRCAAGQGMLTTMDLPVTSHVIQASPNKPFLAMLLLLDLQMIVQLVAEMNLGTALANDADMTHSFSVDLIDRSILDALLRLVDTLDQPQLTAQLAPLIQKEIIVRLLHSRQGGYLRQLVKADSPNQKIRHVVNWLKQNFQQPIRMDDLADQAYMSPSTFRQHFRTITGMSPLQYQKQLRLQEARHLMFNQNLDVGHAAGLVGYESASQFSREYSRLFGDSPQRDIQKMRQMS